MIESNFIRVWLGDKDIPEQFELWWKEFQEMHPKHNFITIRDGEAEILIKECEEEIQKIYYGLKFYAGRANIIRLLALKKYGGVYIDTDTMPIKPFDDLFKKNVFIGKRSSKSCENALIGSHSNSDAINYLFDVMPDWIKTNHHITSPVGPKFISYYWWNRNDVEKLPKEYFYMYDGFLAPSREEKNKIFAKKDFPSCMYSAHFSNKIWGGKPKDFEEYTVKKENDLLDLL